MSSPGREHLLDILKGSVATLALFLAFVTLPVFGLLPGMLAPLPACYFSLKLGRTAGAAIVLLSAVVLSLLGDRTTTAMYLIQSGCLSLLLPYFLCSGKGAAKSLAYSVAVSLALCAAVAVGYAAARGVNVDRQVVRGIESSISQAAAFYEKAGVKGDDLKMMQEGLQQAGRLIGRVYPAMLVITLITIAGTNLLVLVRMGQRLPCLPSVGPFRNFRNPEPLVWVLIGAGFSMLVPHEGVTRVALNVLLVIVFMYFIQGLAVAVHLLERLAVPRLMRLIFYVLLAVQPYLAIGLAVVGIFDIWGDFRSPRTPRQNL